MKLELKKVNIIAARSEETTCFHAILYEDGKPAADCFNEGCGGMTDVLFYDSETQQKVVVFCKEHPVINKFRNKTMFFEGVDIRVDELLIEYQMNEKLKNKQKKSLVLHDSKKEDPSYVIHSFVNLNVNIPGMVGHNIFREVLKEQILKCREKGYVIMNTNIDYKSLGL